MTAPGSPYTLTFTVDTVDMAEYRLGLHRAREALRDKMLTARRMADRGRATVELAKATVHHGIDLPALAAEVQYAEDEADRCQEAVEWITRMLGVLVDGGSSAGGDRT